MELIIVKTLVSHKAESILLSNKYLLSADQFGLEGGFGELPLDEFSLVGAVLEASSFSCGGIAKMLPLEALWLC